MNKGNKQFVLMGDVRVKTPDNKTYKWLRYGTVVTIAAIRTLGRHRTDGGGMEEGTCTRV